MSLDSYGIITGLGPTGGWRFEQPFEGGIQRIPIKGSAGSADALINMVRDFRAQQMIDLGEYELEIAEYIKRVSPINDRFRGKPTVYQSKVKERAGNRKTKPLISRISDWLISVIHKRPKLVNKMDAAERAVICAKCPQNVNWETKCGPCNQTVKDRSRALRQIIFFDHDKSLRACRLHNLPLRAGVFIDREFLPDRHPDAPSFCWMPEKSSSFETKMDSDE